VSGGSNLLSRLGRLLGLRPIPADVAEELAALRVEVSALAQAQAAHRDQAAALREAIEKLEKQTARAGKEQFKANSLAETQQQSVKSMLEQLREANAYRERELAHLRERLVDARAEGRIDLIRRLLPVLDGLDEALNAGQRLLADSALHSAEGATGAHRALSFWQRLIGAGALLAGRLPDERQPEMRSTPLGEEAITAWLEGLEFVRDRLLDVLSAEGVRPIETDGEIFDPNLHVAVEATPAIDGQPTGSVVQETRRGYQIGDVVLRYAEVIVAR
jgi:molecular chaperone GrpE